MRPSSLLFLLALALPCCVERTMTIRSIPADADLFLDGVRVGRTPVTLPFSDYGTREFVVRKPGYEVVRSRETMEEPYFQEFPTDVYYEILTRDLYKDHREFQYVLQPTPESEMTLEAMKASAERTKEARLR